MLCYIHIRIKHDDIYKSHKSINSNWPIYSSKFLSVNVNFLLSHLSGRLVQRLVLLSVLLSFSMKGKGSGFKPSLG